MQEPFDILAGGLVNEKSRGDLLSPFVNEIIGLPTTLIVFPQVYEFSGDAVLELVEPGVYRKGWRSGRSSD